MEAARGSPSSRPAELRKIIPSSEKHLYRESHHGASCSPQQPQNGACGMQGAENSPEAPRAAGAAALSIARLTGGVRRSGKGMGITGRLRVSSPMLRGDLGSPGLGLTQRGPAGPRCPQPQRGMEPGAQVAVGAAGASSLPLTVSYLGSSSGAAWPFVSSLRVTSRLFPLSVASPTPS